MSSRSLLAAMFAGFLAVPMLAQVACPMEKARHVPLDVDYGPAQECGGFSYTVGGVQIGATQKGCPLFIIITPPHDIAEPSILETKVQVTGVSRITMVTFKCTTTWILFIPIGTSCTADQTILGGTVQNLITVSCNQPPPVSN